MQFVSRWGGRVWKYRKTLLLPQIGYFEPFAEPHSGSRPRIIFPLVEYP